MKLEKRAIILATSNNAALFVQYQNGTEDKPWRLPQTRKIGCSWKHAVTAWCYYALGMNIRRQRFYAVKEVEVLGKLRLYFALDLTDDEGLCLSGAQPRPHVRTRLIPFSHLGSEEFVEKELALIKALE